MHRFDRVWFVFVLAFVATACVGEISTDELAEEVDPLETSPVPPAPALMHQVHQVEDKKALGPVIVPARSTADGRLAMSDGASFYLLTPERLTAPFTLGPSGAVMSAPVSVPFDIAAALGVPGKGNETFTGTVLCEPNVASPVACNGGDDCYEVVVLGFAQMAVTTDHGVKNGGQLRSRHLRVRVSKPKTVDAQVVAIDYSPGTALVVGSTYHTEENYPGDTADSTLKFNGSETSMTADGRLFVSRFSRQIYDEPELGMHLVDTFYLVAPLSADPCEATSFGPLLHGIAFAHSDPRMERYGFAKFPLRDAMGRLIPAEQAIGEYPWLDRDGNNLFFTTVGSLLQTPLADGGYANRYQPQDMRLVDGGVGGPPPFSASGGFTRGFTVAGLWTHGKTVLLDGMINNIDFLMGRGTDQQRLVRPYREDVWVRIGSGRDLLASTAPAGLYSNSTIIDSVQNKFNAFPFMRPRLPRDVTWFMANNIGTSEIAFDDYLDNDAFIVASMMPALEFTSVGARLTYHDGLTRSLQPIDPKVQNAATNAELNPPEFGAVTNARLETMALGGIHGRGVYLGPSARIAFDVTKPMPQRDWFISVFVDMRWASSARSRRLITWVDGSAVFLSPTEVIIRDGAGVELGRGAIPPSLQVFSDKRDNAEAAVAQRKGWLQVGVIVSQGGRTLELIIDGMRIATVALLTPAFQSGVGAITLGAVNSGEALNGWVDEFKVIARRPTPEEVCNAAYGSIHEVNLAAASSWWKTLVSDELPIEYHRWVGRALLERPAASRRFVCRVDYRDWQGIYRSQVPSPAFTSLREELLMGVHGVDGRLKWNAARVDFTGSAFCTSCHSASSPAPSLSLDALTPGTRCEAVDSRRQPMQPPARVYGVLSSQFLNATGARPGPDVGPVWFDRFTLPSSTSPIPCLGQ